VDLTLWRGRHPLKPKNWLHTELGKDMWEHRPFQGLWPTAGKRKKIQKPFDDGDVRIYWHVSSELAPEGAVGALGE
jgi:hypothetical protein